MMLECGLGAFSIAIVHIVGHSLYKAHAFLTSGSTVMASPVGAPPQPIGRVQAAAAVATGAIAALLLTAIRVSPEDLGWAASAALSCVFAFGVVFGPESSLRIGGIRRHWVQHSPSSSRHRFSSSCSRVAPRRSTGWSCPAAPPLSAASQFVLALSLVVMGAITWLQLVGFPEGAMAQRAYVLVRSNAYFDLLWDRVSGARYVHGIHENPDLGTPEPATRVYSPGPCAVVEGGGAPGYDDVKGAVERAVSAVPPLWPLSDFVAVNPFLGLLGERFEDASAWLEQSAGARTTMPRDYYAAAIDAGGITREDLVAAVDDGTGKFTLEEVERGARKCDRKISAAPTVADVARGASGIDVPRIVTEQIGEWAGTHYDRGLARWPSPFRNMNAYAAWRAYAALDRSPEVLSLGAMRSHAAMLPETAEEAISFCVARLGLAVEELDLYFQRLLMRVAGWGGHARWTGWSAELKGKSPEGVSELLAISLAWEWMLLESDPHVKSAWPIARHELGVKSNADPEREIDLVLHRAFEIATQRQLAEQLSGSGSLPDAAGGEAAETQVVFCIDVRSERMRRALEATSSKIETKGFAGFFGMGIEWIGLAEDRGVASCPVLLEPGYVVRETGENGEERAAWLRFKRSAARAYHAFKGAAVSSFGFVETFGFAYGVKLMTDSFGLKLGRDKRADLTEPNFDVISMAGRVVGIDLDDRINMAEGALRGMSLTGDFAKLVVFAAHGSTTKNNPYAAGLDCGACGGRSGKPNARVAAAILNDPEVRRALVDRGILIPAETRFAAAVHDTTTDVLSLCDRESIPQSHVGCAEGLVEEFEKAGSLVRLERAPALGIFDRDEDQVLARASDWAQVRPEWGLAGCTSFIVAPRRHTVGKHFGGSAFLHDYDWTADNEFKVLELIMTAPMVVASWINLQYFASTVDNRVFGAGDKVLHNVSGGVGVLEGNGGGLRIGLPMQSVHDGEKFLHRPSRLTVAIAAPIEALNGVIAQHELLRNLLDHHWIHLVALADSGEVTSRYVGDLEWSVPERDERPTLNLGVR